MDQLAGRSFHLPNSPAFIVSMDIVDPTPRSWDAHALGFPDFPLSLRGIVARIRGRPCKGLIRILIPGYWQVLDSHNLLEGWGSCLRF